MLLNARVAAALVVASAAGSFLVTDGSATAGSATRWYKMLGASRGHDMLIDAALVEGADRVAVLVERRDAATGAASLHRWSVDATNGALVEDVALPVDPVSPPLVLRATAALGADGALLQVLGTRYLISGERGAMRTATGPALDTLMTWAWLDADHLLVSGQIASDPRAVILDVRGGPARNIELPEPKPLLTSIVAAAGGSAFAVGGIYSPGDARGVAWVGRFELDKGLVASKTLADGHEPTLAVASDKSALVVIDASPDPKTRTLVALGFSPKLEERSRSSIADLAQHGLTLAPTLCPLPKGNFLLASSENEKSWFAKLDAKAKAQTFEPRLEQAQTPPFLLLCRENAAFVVSLGISRLTEKGRYVNFQKVQMQRFAAEGAKS